MSRVGVGPISKAENEGAKAIHSDRRLPALTGLRIFAAVAVYFSHIGPPVGSPSWLETFFHSGYCGVTIFFVLSGFVLSYNYFDELRRPGAGTIWEYLVARFARVYPLYIAILFLLVMELHASGDSIAGWWRHALAIQAWDPSAEVAFGFNQVAWSLSVEFFLYACLPFLIPLAALLRKPRAMLLAGAVVVLVLGGLAAWFVATGKGSLPYTDPNSAHRWLYRTPLTRLGDFALGIIAARLFVTVGHLPDIRRLGRYLTPAAAVLIVALMCWPKLFYSAWSWDFAYAPPAAVLMFGLAVAPRTWLARLCSLSGVILLGEASYAFYLIHAEAIGWLGAGQWSTASSPSRVIVEALLLGLILCLAVGLHVAFEMPARKLLRGLLSLRPDSPLSRLRGRLTKPGASAA